MNTKMMIRGALLGAITLLAASCFSKEDLKSEYDAHVLFGFEPEDEYVWLDFVDQFFNVGKDTVSFFPSLSNGPVYFFAKVDDNDGFQGGLALCRGKDHDASEGRAPSYFAVYDEYGGNQKSHAYGVFHDNAPSLMPEHFVQIAIPNTLSSCSGEYVYVHNVQAAVQAAKYGVNLAGGPFVAGDYLLLTITGMLGTQVTGSVEVKLIDGTEYVYEWKKVDLTTLGKLDAIDFKLTSSRADFPLYCCLDDLGVHYVEIYQ